MVALGPLTNLAHALMQEPQIAHFVKEVVIFAGAITKVPEIVVPALKQMFGEIRMQLISFLQRHGLLL